MRPGGMRGGGHLLIGLGGELSDKRIKIEGAMGVDGFCWMEGCNNQSKVNRIIGILSWETARREDAIATFWQLDFEAKK
jgi:hypothetical protein